MMVVLVTEVCGSILDQLKEIYLRYLKFRILFFWNSEFIIFLFDPFYVYSLQSFLSLWLTKLQFTDLAGLYSKLDAGF